MATIWAVALGFACSCALAPTGGWLSDEPSSLGQLVWEAPILWLSPLGAVLALGIGTRPGMTGTLTGMWLLEFIAHGLFNARA